MALIRPARPGDVPALFRIRTSVRENLLTLAELDALGVTPAAVAALIAAEPCAWVAEAAGQPVGFALVKYDEACVFALFVAPEHEGRGLGRALLARAEAALFARHARIWLITGPGTRAARLYRRAGWTPAGRGGGEERFEKAAPAGLPWPPSGK